MAFAGVEVVKGVDLALCPGEVHALIGENGAGKSTVAKILAGVHRPTGGTLDLRGVPIRFEGPRDALIRGVALIHQEPLTFPELEVAENVFVGHQPVRGPSKNVHWKEMRRKAGAILDSLGLSLDPRSQVGSLSVADQQMVELAAALSHSAEVLILDETTASLTPTEVAELFAIVRTLKERGAAILFVSHRLDEIFTISDRITVMRDGLKVAELRPSETTREEIVRLMVGREIAQPASAAAVHPDTTVLLRVQGLRVPGRVHGVDLELRSGEILGFAGLVGAGRTEVAEAIFGLRRATWDSLELNGRPARVRSPLDAMRMGVGLVPEDRQHAGLLMPASIQENAVLAALRKFAKLGWTSRKRERAAAEERL
ncbi:MAG TPA: sugar ABC transporter ATP-binding protein, partial [Isosphaeraceae bacterium]|nr:sugar ABC transporter ATP-binding protein [Isosphaeraceae bacterium]